MHLKFSDLSRYSIRSANETSRLAHLKLSRLPIKFDCFNFSMNDVFAQRLIFSFQLPAAVFTTPWLKRWSHSSLPSFHVCFPLSVGYILIRQVRTIDTFKKMWSQFIFTRWMPACVMDVFLLYVGEWWHIWLCAVCDERVVLKNIDANIVVQKGNLLVVCYQFHPCTCFVRAISFTLCVLFSITLYVHIAAFKAGIMSRVHIHKCRR